jgi:hypothetical protein
MVMTGAAVARRMRKIVGRRGKAARSMLVNRRPRSEWIGTFPSAFAARLP